PSANPFFARLSNAPQSCGRSHPDSFTLVIEKLGSLRFIVHKVGELMRKIVRKPNTNRQLLSPFRYPGRKTWLRPVIRQRLRAKKTNRDLIWATILKNRMSHGGLIAPGSGLLKEGESGKGLRSRWYPKTLTRRIKAIHALKNRITFRQANALRSLSRNHRGS